MRKWEWIFRNPIPSLASSHQRDSLQDGEALLRKGVDLSHLVVLLVVELGVLPLLRILHPVRRLHKRVR